MVNGSAGWPHPGPTVIEIVMHSLIGQGARIQYSASQILSEIRSHNPKLRHIKFSAAPEG